MPPRQKALPAAVETAKFEGGRPDAMPDQSIFTGSVMATISPAAFRKAANMSSASTSCAMLLDAMRKRTFGSLSGPPQHGALSQGPELRVWNMLKEGYDYFEITCWPTSPRVRVVSWRR